MVINQFIDKFNNLFSENYVSQTPEYIPIWHEMYIAY